MNHKRKIPMRGEERRRYEKYVVEMTRAKMGGRNASITPRRWSRATLHRSALIAVIAGAIIVVGILILPRIGNIADARSIRKYSTKRLECPLCRNVSYSTEYNFIDIPEELNEKKLVTCPKCHEHVSYFDLEEVKEES